MPMALDGTLIRLWSSALHLGQRLSRAALAEAAPDGGPGWERHTVPTLLVCLEGVVRIELHGRPCDLHPDEALLLAPGTPHRHAPLRQRCASLGFGFMLGRTDLELTTPDEAWTLTIDEQPARRLVEQACVAGTRERLHLVREAAAQLAADRATPLAPMPGPVRRMWLYLRARRLEPITAADVLRASGLGPSRAREHFRRWFGTGPLALLREHRLEYAGFLLARGRAPGEVAAACGFRSRRHLTAACRRVLGVPPSRLAGR